MNRSALVLVLSFVAIVSGKMSAASAIQGQGSKPCSAPQYHQFDFWLGDWDVFDNDPHTLVARAKVSSILDGCVLLEEYEQTDGLKGKSFSIYDASRDVWHQSWVTNRGQLLWMEGHYANNEMVLIGSEDLRAGIEKQARGTWKQVRDGVRETAVTSTDGGKHWDLWFDLMFHRRKQ
jgi:hypothetical protein